MTLRELAESAGGALLRRVGRAYGRIQESTPLEADLLESDDTVIVVFDAPGVKSSDVQVRFVDDRVLVRIDRFRPFREGYEMRFPGRGLSLNGDVTMPEDVQVDPDAASATLTDRGTLEITLPKRELESMDEATDSEAESATAAEESAAQTVDFEDEQGDEDTKTDANEPDEGSTDESGSTESEMQEADEDEASSEDSE